MVLHLKNEAMFVNPIVRFPRLNQPRICRTKWRMRSESGEYTAAMIVPTGVGARIGGYAGDAMPSARLIASIADNLITHPNVLNGALMYWHLPNAYYVEGNSLDDFASGKCNLMKDGGSNLVGLVLDKSLSEEERIHHMQVADGARATLGLNISQHVVLTDMDLEVSLSKKEGGSSWGTVKNMESALRAAASLKHTYNCDAIAIVAKFPEEEVEDLETYRAGEGVDTIAGAEAVISRLISRELKLPCAHAPALEPLEPDSTVSPKAAAEELGYTFLSCVLVGLANAPRILSPLERNGRALKAADVDAVVVANGCFGGSAVLSFAANPKTMIIVVEENGTVMNVGASDVGLPPERVVYARSYAEAAGILAAHKAGINLHSITSKVPQTVLHESTLATKIPALRV